jgi:hypothetical protein
MEILSIEELKALHKAQDDLNEAIKSVSDRVRRNPDMQREIIRKAWEDSYSFEDEDPLDGWEIDWSLTDGNFIAVSDPSGDVDDTFVMWEELMEGVDTRSEGVVS